MARIKKYLVAAVLTVVFFACKRQLHFPVQPPVAVAGKDTTIVLQLGFTMLNGSTSKDPGGDTVFCVQCS